MATTAPSSGTPSAAMCSELNPEYDVPNIPTRPLDHGCVASHSMTGAQVGALGVGVLVGGRPARRAGAAQVETADREAGLVGEPDVRVAVRRGEVVLAVRQRLEQRRERPVAVGQVQRRRQTGRRRPS